MSNSSNHVPSASSIISWVEESYDLTVNSASRLEGEVDYNFLLQTSQGKLVAKFSRSGTDPAAIEFQLAILKHLKEKKLPFATPVLLSNLAGEVLTIVQIEGAAHYLRLQTWVEGRMLDNVNPRTSALWNDWGKTTGQLRAALDDFNHPYAHRSYAWNPSETLLSQPYAAYFTTDEQREIANYFWALFTEQTLPQLPALRQGINYNDAHEHNLLVTQDPLNPTVCGVIDFGDALYTQTVNEVAIACAYAGMHQPDPLAAMAELVTGFHSTYPLEEDELACLFSLVTARLLITVSRSAYNKHHEPDNEYLTISERPAWALLRQLRSISPSFAQYKFREACGMQPVPGPGFRAYAEQATFHPVIDFGERKLVELDFKVASLALGSSANYLAAQPFASTVERMISDEQAGSIGVGGYGETRPFYTTDAYQSEGNMGPRWRTTHLGYDIWMEAGTPVYTPLDGKVHSFKYDAADRSYGATILLEHEPKGWSKFYTLYGHLGKASLEGLFIGKPIVAGAQIATIGPYEENGGWPPHLHLQILLDTLGNEGDFPGVAYPEEAALWLAICPDPRFLLGLAVPNDIASRTDFATLKSQLLKKRKEQLGYSLSVSYQEPLHIVRGWQQYLLDTSGRRYLDTVNNVAHVGHEHPAVVRAGQRQMAVLNTNSRYLHEQIVGFAEELAATFPQELSVVHFVNSGSEANELALRMCEAWSGTRNMVAVEVGYHGNTGRTIDISSYKFDGKGGKGAPPNTRLVPLPDVYRGRHQNPETAGADYANYVAQAINEFAELGEKTGGFICESILSCGGQIVLPAGYLTAAYEHIRAAGGLCVADEVQVGLGRVGSHFWGFELQGVVPDIVVIGKPLGNGHPLGAVVCTPAVAAKFANGMEYFNTFGGNPVSCAIGREVLSVVQDEQLQRHALETGNYLLARLRELQDDFPIIGDVRGVGLFLGIELVTDREQKTPATAQASYLTNRMRQLGFLMSTDGPAENVLKIKPPLCFTRQNADELVKYLRRVLGEDGVG